MLRDIRGNREMRTSVDDMEELQNNVLERLSGKSNGLTVYRTVERHSPITRRGVVDLHISSPCFLGGGEVVEKDLAISIPGARRIVTVHAYLIVAGRKLSPRKIVLTSEYLRSETIYRVFTIKEESWWRTLTRGHLSLFTMETLYDRDVGYLCAGYPQVEAYIGRPDQGPDPRTHTAACRGGNLRLSDLYGIDATDASAEFVLKASRERTIRRTGMKRTPLPLDSDPSQ
jgi:hypothetical protein